MTKKNLKPQQAAPVQRENTATVSRDGNAIAPSMTGEDANYYRYNNNRWVPFAGDDAE
jgi:prenylated cyclic peptide (anacyclamide/piricyclamide family)